MKIIITSICIMILLLVTACFSPSVKKGVKAPIVILTTLRGENIDLTQYKGKVILMNFWATWCGPCRKELLELESLQKEFSEDEFLILAVNKKEPIEKVKAFLAERRLGLTVLLDPQGSLSSSYGVRALPTNILIDSGGIVRATAAGYNKSKLNGLRQQIKRLIAEKH